MPRTQEPCPAHYQEMLSSKKAVVKVGGSLFARADLGGRLRGLLQSLGIETVLLFPGGGGTADAVRSLDQVHGLGDEAAHWLALRTLTVNAHFLNSMLPELPVLGWPAAREHSGAAILEPF